MILIWILLIFITILSVLNHCVNIRYNTYQTDSINHFTSKNTNKFFYSLIVLCMIIVSGLRSSIGDTGYYMYSYVNIPKDLSELFNFQDFGFFILQYLLSEINSSPQFFLLVISTIITLAIMTTIFRYSASKTLSIFLFITMGMYLSTMNGIRQYLVAAILFSGSKYLFNNERNKYFILTIMMSFFHQSAVIMLPIYFFVTNKAWSRRNNFIIFFSLLFFVLFNSLFEIFTNLLSFTPYDKYIESFGTEEYAGANLLRILVSGVPVIMSFVYRYKIKDKIYCYNILTNFAILNFIFMLFSYYNWLFARFTMYFELYNLLLLPGIMAFAFKKETRTLLIYIMVILYAVFFYFDTIDTVYASYFLKINRDFIGPLTWSFYQ